MMPRFWAKIAVFGLVIHVKRLSVEKARRCDLEGDCSNNTPPLQSKHNMLRRQVLTLMNLLGSITIWRPATTPAFEILSASVRF